MHLVLSWRVQALSYRVQVAVIPNPLQLLGGSERIHAPEGVGAF